MRMTDEAGAIISPEKFLTTAERYQLAPAIDRWVIENALRWLVSEADERERRGLTDGVRLVPGSYTAQAIIITDTDNNQITAFHPGAMQSAQLTVVPARSDIRIAIIAPGRIWPILICCAGECPT